MADITRLSRLVAGMQRHVDLQQNALVVGSLKVGTSSPTELTQVLLDGLLAIRTDLASTANGEGASLIGIEDSAAQYTATDVEGALAEVMDAAQAAQATANAAIPASEKGANNGVATLDGSGKIPAAQLPNSVMELQGAWDATANDPVLVDGTGNPGDVYEVTVAGDQDLGSGSKHFDAGDFVIYGADGVWYRSDSTDAVASVNGQVGVVSLTTSDISEGSNLYYTAARFNTAFGTKSTTDLAEGSNLYYTNARFDTRFGTKTTSDLTEGSNLYYTAARFNSAFSAKSTSDLSEGSNLYYTAARFDSAFAGKSAADLAYSNSTSGLSASNVQAAIDEVEGRVDALEAASTESLRRAKLAGESLSAATLYAVRFGRPANSETSGRMYKADNDATSVDNFHVAGLVLTTGAVSAGGSISMYKLGKMTVASHGFTIGQPIWLGASGALTSTAPSSANIAAVKVGMAEDANTIDVQIEIMGVN